jgi:hypothetical protein
VNNNDEAQQARTAGETTVANRMGLLTSANPRPEEWPALLVESRTRRQWVENLILVSCEVLEEHSELGPRDRQVGGK